MSHLSTTSRSEPIDSSRDGLANERLAYLDAARAFALLLGIIFHASLSFMPIFIGWAVMDVSTMSPIAGFVLISHSFRMELFFMMAGFFSHRVFHRRGAGSFMKSRIMRVAIPFAVGWFILRPLLVSGWIMGMASMQGEADVMAGLKGGFQSLQTLPAGLFTGTHLWFLYHLLMITLAVVGARQLLALVPALHRNIASATDRALDWAGGFSPAILLLALPTAVCLGFMQTWGMDTPDKSLVPNIPVFLIYAGFFSLGWVLHRKENLMERFSRPGPTLCIVSAFGIISSIALVRFQAQPGHPQFHLLHATFVLCYALMMWSLVWITIGTFRRIFNKPNPLVRYIADASYWLYLVHLPIVVWLQIAFAELPLHGSVKLVAISVMTLGLSLLLYDILVRPTFLGQILNGRKKARAISLKKVYNFKKAST